MNEGDKNSEQSVSDMLREAGFGHRPSKFLDKREVFNLTTGEVVGQFDALEACDFLRAAPST